MLESPYLQPGRRRILFPRGRLLHLVAQQLLEPEPRKL